VPIEAFIVHRRWRSLATYLLLFLLASPPDPICSMTLPSVTSHTALTTHLFTNFRSTSAALARDRQADQWPEAWWGVDVTCPAVHGAPHCTVLQCSQQLAPLIDDRLTRRQQQQQRKALPTATAAAENCVRDVCFLRLLGCRGMLVSDRDSWVCPSVGGAK